MDDECSPAHMGASVTFSFLHCRPHETEEGMLDQEKPVPPAFRSPRGVVGEKPSALSKGQQQPYGSDQLGAALGVPMRGKTEEGNKAQLLDSRALLHSSAASIAGVDPVS